MKAFNISPSITVRDDGSLDRYFNDIRKIDVLSAEDETELVSRIKKGELDALNRLVTGNLRFVVSVAKQYQHRGVSISDLINEGNVGLITAAKRFDENHGCKFISYAIWWIRQAINTAVIEQSRMVHLPYNFTTVMGKFNKGVSKLEQKFARKPTLEEVSGYLNLDTEKMADVVAFSGSEISMDKPLTSEVGQTLHDIISTPDYGVDQELLTDSRQLVIRQSMAILNPRDRQILTMYFGLDIASPIPLEEIAGKLGISVEHTRRIKDSALLRLRNSSHGPTLMSCIN
ncbi:sigma-70 family RNA polymerase sigma factor [Mucilaginibacter lappiensis]|uniref:sigma-70 family RNA polymerase sigma factor n=1 Tax=Mucilaginibacter lappiensis TaxID=354630 RepID=UPI003D2207F3